MNTYIICEIQGGIAHIDRSDSATVSITLRTGYGAGHGPEATS